MLILGQIGFAPQKSWIDTLGPTDDPIQSYLNKKPASPRSPHPMMEEMMEESSDDEEVEDEGKREEKEPKSIIKPPPPIDYTKYTKESNEIQQGILRARPLNNLETTVIGVVHNLQPSLTSQRTYRSLDPDIISCTAQGKICGLKSGIAHFIMQSAKTQAVAVVKIIVKEPTPIKIKWTTPASTFRYIPSSTTDQEEKTPVNVDDWLLHKDHQLIHYSPVPLPPPQDDKMKSYFPLQPRKPRDPEVWFCLALLCTEF